MKLIAIGCCPSSGSTLLADLLDAAPSAVCPPELYIFSVPEAYDYSETFKGDAIQKHRFPLTTPYTTRSRFFNRKYLAQVGLSDDELSQMILDSVSLRDFVTRFAENYAIFRRKHIDVFVEKTPINLNCAEQFCRQFPDCVFIVVVRDGRSVVMSLMRRGYSLSVSIYIWLRQILAGSGLLTYGNAIFVRYEDLTRNPFEITAQLLNRMGIATKANEIAECFPKNEYRKNLPRVNTWTQSRFDGTITVVNHSLDKHLEAYMLNSDLVYKHADGRMERIASFRDHLESNGYSTTNSDRFFLEDFWEAISKPFRKYKLIPKNVYLMANSRGYVLGLKEFIVLLNAVLKRDVTPKGLYRIVRTPGNSGYELQFVFHKTRARGLSRVLRRLHALVGQRRIKTETNRVL